MLCFQRFIIQIQSMKSVLLRTGSLPLNSPAFSGSPRLSLSRHDSVYGVFSGEKINVSPRISMSFDINHRRDTPARGIRRALSSSDVIGPENEVSVSRRFVKLSGTGSRSLPAIIPEEDNLAGEIKDSVGSVIPNDTGFESSNYAEDWPVHSIYMEEFEFSDSGIGKGRKSGNVGEDIITGKFFGGNSDSSKIGDYYREMLKSNPNDSLLLRNYGKFLHEVEKDTVRAEEYYGRAILASPGDGDLLSLYGKLIWMTQRDEERAKIYFDRAVSACPDDCNVLGAYAHFMWEAEEEEDIEKMEEILPALVTAF